MYEMSKQILQKVSFDKSLFTKELKKAIKWVKKDELLMLKAFCVASFGHLYADVIKDSFEAIA